MGNQGGKALKWLPAHFNFGKSLATSSGQFVPKSGVGRGTGAFIYALPADETSPLFPASPPQTKPCFPAASNVLAFPGGNPIFAATPTERITHYTLQAKSCAKWGRCPLWKPPQEKAIRYPSTGRISPFLVIQPSGYIYRAKASGVVVWYL